MRDQEESIALESPDTPNPKLGVFREVALLHLPVPWRPALRHLGGWLFDWSMERWGIALEMPHGTPTAAKRAEAMTADLRSVREQLESFSDEAGDSEMDEAEYRLLRKAGEIADKLEPIEVQLEQIVAEAIGTVLDLEDS